MMRDRRLVPRLIELMDNASPAVKKAATEGVASLILLPLADLTTAKAKAWWDLNWNVPERQVLARAAAQQRSPHRVEAAKGLYDLRDKSMVPVVIKLLKRRPQGGVTDAIEVIVKITGNDWSFSTDLPADKRTQIIANLDKWWKENQNRFEWIEDRNAARRRGGQGGRSPGAADPAVGERRGQAVRDSLRHLCAARARRRCQRSSPPLHDRNTLIRLKCNDILKAISKQDFKFDAHAEEDKLDRLDRTVAAMGDLAEDPARGGAGGRYRSRPRRPARTPQGERGGR
jgi:hypothetical protein